MDEVDDSNENSLLIVTNDLGCMNCFLDGSFPLGSISLGTDLAVLSLTKRPTCPVLLAHLCKLISNTNTDIFLPPVVVGIPLFEHRQLRDLAKLSSTARELIWYAMCVVQEMHNVWSGSEASSGAQELGPRFIQALQSKQKEQFGREHLLTSNHCYLVHSSAEDSPDPMLDLTTLLVTGRASDALLDFLGSGEQMSERASHFFLFQACLDYS
jgi:anaphase-promoting complex subunit 4